MKHYQESTIEFRRAEPDGFNYPVSRGLVVFQYGGTIEKCIEEARKTFNLGSEWEVIETSKP